MKKKKAKSSPSHSIARKYINIAALFVIGAYFVFTPTLGHIPGRVHPRVKAAYISQPPLPVSRNIPAPILTAEGVFMIDIDTNSILFEKNPNQRLKPASLTKIMTSLVALDHFSEDSAMKIISGQSSVGNTAKLIKGDELMAKDVLYALLVPSGNDAAVTLAENYPGGYGVFLEKMNQKVVDMGLKNTHFSNVSGIESPDHYTSAFDILIIARNALNRPFFSSIVNTKNITFQSLKGHSYSVNSTNILLGKLGIQGVKTGWTPEAGECLVILAERNGHSILVSILNSEDRFGEAELLVNWAFDNYSWE